MIAGLLARRSGLLAALLVFLHPLQFSAQSNMGSIQLNPAVSKEAEYQVEPLGWAAPVRFKSGTPREIGTQLLIFAAARSSEGVTVPISRLPSTLPAGWLKRAASRERARLNLAAASTDSGMALRPSIPLVPADDTRGAVSPNLRCKASRRSPSAIGASVDRKVMIRL